MNRVSSPILEECCKCCSTDRGCLQSLTIPYSYHHVCWPGVGYSARVRGHMATGPTVKGPRLGWKFASGGWKCVILVGFFHGCGCRLGAAGVSFLGTAIFDKMTDTTETFGLAVSAHIILLPFSSVIPAAVRCGKCGVGICWLLSRIQVQQLIANIAVGC